MATADPSQLVACAVVRYGAMAEVARFLAEDLPDPGMTVVVETARGPQIGTVIGTSRVDPEQSILRNVLRIATEDDRHQATALKETCEADFSLWQERIAEWDVDVQLIDLERTLEGDKQILYVLNDRGPETTKLALRAAAAGLGVVEVQSVGPDGVVEQSGGGGCGSCGHK